MKHSTRIRALRQWTHRILLINSQRAENRAWYVANIGKYRAMSELEQESPEGQRLRNNLFDRLREGIDPLPVPTNSDLR